MALRREADDRSRRRTRGRWEDAPGIPGFFTTVDHKRIGLRYIYTAFVFFFVAGTARARHARAARRARRARADPEDVQRVLHDARHDDDLPVQHAGARGVRQLPHAVADRQPRHGVPALERLQLLDLPARGHLPVLELRRRPPPDGGWFAYVPLTGEAVLAGHQPRLLGPRRRLRRHLHDRRRGELHRHDLQDARAGHDASTACRSSCGRCSCSRSW